MKRPRQLAAPWLLTALLALGAEARTWTSRSGATVEAEHVRTTGALVILRRPNGEMVRISRVDLSAGDQAWLDRQAAPAAPVAPPAPAGPGKVDVAPGTAVEDPEIRPGASFRLTFPELPRNLDGGAAELSVRLPTTYDPQKQYPLALWVNGGRGTSVGGRRDIVDADRYIVIGLPIIQKQGARTETVTGKDVHVGYEDADTMGKAWSAMLARLELVVPNIQLSRGVAGGFSNGAHSIALVLDDHRDEFRRYFGAFIFAEGGYLMKRRAATQGCPVAVIAGETSWAAKEFGISGSHSYDARDFARRFDGELIVMPGVGHTLTGDAVAKARAYLQKKGF